MKCRIAAIIPLMVMTALGFSACSEETTLPTSDTLNEGSSEGEGQRLGPPSLAYNYPSVSLSVPFLVQLPPGTDWKQTNNCGQTCCVMLGGYYNNGAVAEWVINEENRQMGCSRPYGCQMGPTDIKNLLWNFHRLNTELRYGNLANDVINEVVNNRRPTIIACMIKDGKIVSSGGVGHWALAVGWDQSGQRLILNDPGTNGGNHKSMPVADFEASWATQGKKYMPVWK